MAGTEPKIRPVLFLPVLALMALSGWLGLRMGQVPEETDIIRHYAERYLTEAAEGAALTDCAAAPYPDAWMVVVCTPPAGPPRSYIVGARGQLLRQDVPAI